MSQPTLNGVWAKMERAKEHRDALQSYIAETFAIEENRPRLGAKFDPERGRNVLYVSFVPDLRDVFLRSSILLGDSLQALRTALDHLVYQLAVRHKGVRRERELEFPITELPGEWKTARRRSLSQIRPADRTVIEGYQGYHRIDERLAVGLYFHPLVMLRDLNDRDKHRLLNTVIVPTNSIEITTEPGYTIMFTGILDLIQDTLTGVTIEEATPVELGTVVASSSTTSPLQAEVDMVGYVSPQIALADGRPVVAVLDKIAGVVVRVIREFEPFP